MPRYDARRIEAKWQSYWDEHGTFVTSNAPREGATGKLYVLDMFPYPSGDGLHVGHPEGYTATDIVSRYWRMKGRHVLHPMGWDAFGLPAEQHAIKTGTHPRETTQKNIDTFRRQLKMLGFSYDWTREISTTDEDYYRWTQWIFLQLYDTWYDPEFEWTGPDGRPRKGKGRPISELPIPEHLKSRQASPGRQSGDGGAEPATNPGTNVPGSPEDAIRRYQDAHRLAYQSDAPVNWCPELGTVLANEEVTADGKSERGHHPVERRKLRQWMLRITSYAERLLTELDDLDWTESIKLLQRNWIGKSLGAEVDFFVGEGTSLSSQQQEFGRWKDARREIGFPPHAGDLVLRVYTTRPDTLFGATYMVVAPEHPIVDLITTEQQQKQVNAYREKVSRKSDLDRTDLAREKTGVFTGAHAINPVNGEPVPIWIADYVLMSYGTGAIMAVPGHDERDLQFARTFDLPIIEVVEAPNGQENVGFTGEGAAINSGKYNGLPTAEFKQQIAADLAEAGLGRQAVNYRLRDWLFSRQRYWGEPFPIWHELDENGKPTGLTRAVSEDQLPVTLPDMEDFKPKGTPDPPLSWAPDEWLYATAEPAPAQAGGTRLMRETNSMPQWAGSCWYYLRFADPKNDQQFIDPDVEKYWLPVDLYIGGAEHAVLHLLYSRFWHKVLFDRGHVSSPEPFQRLVNQGMILGEPELTGFRTTAAAAEGEGVYDAATLKPLLQARGHIEKVGALAVDHFEGTLAERWPQYSHLEGDGKTCLYSALRNGAIKVSTDRTALQAIDQHASLQTVRETIRRLEPTAPADQDPIRWWNNEKGLDATLRMLDAAVESLSQATQQEWVSAEQVSEAGDGQSVDAHGRLVEEVKLSENDVTRTEGRMVLKAQPQIAVLSQAHKMSKSRGNVINPDEVVQQYGADSLRLYEMFMGPLEQVKPWSMSGVEGVSRFLGRAWRMIVDERADELQLNPAVQEIELTAELDRTLHKTIQAVSDDIEKLSFNTAISRLMEFTNEFSKADPRPKGAMCAFVKLLSPFAPHIAEELWQLLGFGQSIAYEPWPEFDPAKVTEDTIEIPVQINGKLRAKVLVPADANPQAMQQIAEASEDVQSHISGKNVVKVIAVPGRMVNFVVKG